MGGPLSGEVSAESILLRRAPVIKQGRSLSVRRQILVPNRLHGDPDLHTSIFNLLPSCDHIHSQSLPPYDTAHGIISRRAIACLLFPILWWCSSFRTRALSSWHGPWLLHSGNRP